MGTITKKAFPVLNMHCAGCANNVEKTVRKLPGIVDASVNLATNTLSVSYEADKLAPGEIRAAVLSGGYDLIIEEENLKEERREEAQHQHYRKLKMQGRRCLGIRCSDVAFVYGLHACAIFKRDTAITDPCGDDSFRRFVLHGRMEAGEVRT